MVQLVVPVEVVLDLGFAADNFPLVRFQFRGIQMLHPPAVLFHVPDVPVPGALVVLFQHLWVDVLVLAEQVLQAETVISFTPNQQYRNTVKLITWPLPRPRPRPLP